MANATYSFASFGSIQTKLHGAVTRELALRIIETEGRGETLNFPNEGELSSQLGVSRTVVREAVKVLADKGMVQTRPRTGTQSLPRDSWNLLDPDILTWKAESAPDLRFLLDLCEVRLAIEPTASGFAAVRATSDKLEQIAQCLARREALPSNATLESFVDCDLKFFEAVLDASGNPLLMNLHSIIRTPFRTTLLCVFRSSTAVALELKAQRDLLKALQRKDPSAATKAAERAVSLAMVGIQEKLDAKGSSRRAKS